MHAPQSQGCLLNVFVSPKGFFYCCALFCIAITVAHKDAQVCYTRDAQVLIKEKNTNDK
jgi:hypothetical protein